MGGPGWIKYDMDRELSLNWVLCNINRIDNLQLLLPEQVNELKSFMDLHTVVSFQEQLKINDD